MSSRERGMDGNIYAFVDASLFIMMVFNKSLKICFAGGFIIFLKEVQEKKK